MTKKILPLLLFLPLAACKPDAATLKKIADLENTVRQKDAALQEAEEEKTRLRTLGEEATAVARQAMEVAQKQEKKYEEKKEEFLKMTKEAQAALEKIRKPAESAEDPFSRGNLDEPQKPKPAVTLTESLGKLETTSGQTYAKVIVTKILPDGIQISHESGTGKIPFEQLSPELQDRYGYDPQAAADAREEQAAKEAQAREAEAAAVQKARQQAAQQKALQNIKATGQPVWIKVFQNAGDDFVLCNWGRIIRTEIMSTTGLSPRPTGTFSEQKGTEETTTILVRGLGDIPDDYTWTGILYPCGTKTYSTVLGSGRTVRQFATTPELAAKLLSR